MKKILVSGDSWTSGWPLEETVPREKFTWPNLVAQHFECDLVDKSRSGSSNYRIYRKGFEGILDSSVDTVIIFLSSWTRWETGSTIGEKPGRIHQHLVGFKSPSLRTDYKIFQNFFNGYKQLTDSYRMIIGLQNLACQYNKRCYFLDTFNNNVYTKYHITLAEFKKILQYNFAEFDAMDDNRIKEKYNKVVNLYKHIQKETFICNDSYQEIIKDCKLDRNHPVKDGHQKIAQVVIDFLEGENSGKTI
jgi:hypothetical protein